MSENKCGFDVVLASSVPVTGIKWNGELLPLTPKQAEIMGKLLAKPEVDATDLADTNRASLTVQIAHIRGILADLGVPARIVNLRPSGTRGHARNGERTRYRLELL